MRILESQLREIIRKELRESSSAQRLNEVAFPFTSSDREEGNKFRAWVNDNKTEEEIAALYPDWRDKKLGTSGRPDNTYVKKAWAAFGDEYSNQGGSIGRSIADFLASASGSGSGSSSGARERPSERVSGPESELEMIVAGEIPTSSRRGKPSFGPGDRGAIIKVIQRAVGASVDSGPVGIFGDNTLASVKEYQREHDLNSVGSRAGDVPGIVGKLTAQSILDGVTSSTATRGAENIPPAASPEEGGVEDDGIVYHDSVEEAGIKIVGGDVDRVKQGREARNIYACTATGCAQFVNDTLGPQGGNAWHQHDHGNSGFDAKAPDMADDLAELFTLMNRSGGSASLSAVRNLVKDAVPSQEMFGDLPLGTVVGIFHSPSSFHAKAFFEGATGRSWEGMPPFSGAGSSTAEGPFFVRADTGEPWSPEDLGQNIEFAPSPKLTAGKGFGMNTHLGFVGAKYNDEPIIFHNIPGDDGGSVYATPLRAMGRRDSIAWAKPDVGYLSYLLKQIG